MQTHNLKNVFSHLDKDEKSDIHMLQLTEGPTAIFAAELKAGKKLPAHFHNQGVEVYQILSGDGTFELGQVTDGQVVWEECLPVKEGDLFEVQAGQVHRLSGGREDLRLLFITPPTHLGEDRTFIE
jgi:mannose-6-phosphate isomerase-like protein (cupin superfamily)